MNKRKVLITGGTGLLGKALIEEDNNQTEILATYFGDYEMAGVKSVIYKKADVYDKRASEKLFMDFKPDVVIHTASIGSPDFAEKNKELTWKINVEGTQNTIELCRQAGVRFVFVSSNGVYAGDNAPYDEAALAQPINYYGMTKLEGERLTKKSGLVCSIVRPILMYGWNHSFERSNIVTLSLSKIRRNEEVFAYDDVYANPLYSGSCAQAIWRIINLDKYDVYNIAGADKVSILELLKEMAKVFGGNPGLIKPVKQGYFNELVPRPKNTIFNTKKMENVLGLKPLTLAEGLELMKKNNK